jgi:hypothetical protein
LQQRPDDHDPTGEPPLVLAQGPGQSNHHKIAREADPAFHAMGLEELIAKEE